MGRILLLVELKGGNDGLNTLVPYADPKYRELRPALGVAREHALPLDEKVGLHDKLEPLMESWKAKDLAILQGVGYPYPNRSHFRSIEIWDTASAASQTLSEGWIAQAFQDARLPKDAAVDSIVADTNALPVTGPSLRTIVMQDAENFLRQAETMKETGGMADAGNPALRHVLAVRQEINAAAAGLRDKLRAAPAPAHAYNQDSGLGRDKSRHGRLRHPRQPGADSRAAARCSRHRPRDPAQEPDRRQSLERRRRHDLFGVRPPGAPECQRRYRPRISGAAVRDGRRRRAGRRRAHTAGHRGSWDARS